jgi:hypothetical protein
MIIIKKIDTFRDGGSIGIDAWISSTENISLEPNFPLITIDLSFPDGGGSWYNGWRREGGTKIENEEFKAKVIKAIEEHIAREQQILNTIKELNK